MSRIYLDLKMGGAKVEGESKRANWEGKIECLSFDYEARVPYQLPDMVSQDPQFGVVQVTKRIDATSIPLMKGILDSKQKVDEATFHFVVRDEGGEGGEKELYTVKLVDARIARIQQSGWVPTEKKSVADRPTETVEFVFREIQHDIPGKGSADHKLF